MLGSCLIQEILLKKLCFCFTFLRVFCANQNVAAFVPAWRNHNRKQSPSSRSDVSAWDDLQANAKGDRQKILEIPVRVLLTKNERSEADFGRRRRAAGACFGEPPAGWMTDELRPVKRVQQDTFGQDVVHSWAWASPAIKIVVLLGLLIYEL